MDINFFTANGSNVDQFWSALSDYGGIYLDWSYWIFCAYLWNLIVGPLHFIVLIYLLAVFAYLFKLCRRIEWKDTLRSGREGGFWNDARAIQSYVWAICSYFYHGYEVHGLENIPKEGPALLVFYHGVIPLDMYYLIARIYLQTGRFSASVVDKFTFNVPGWGSLLQMVSGHVGSIESCTKILQDGNLLSIAPGGVYEAQFSDNDYNLMWKQRLGFVKVAINAKAPIIPIFTENIRDPFLVFPFFNKFFLWIYNKTHLPAKPIFGYYPVKLKTHIGRPIGADADMTPEQLKEIVVGEMECLINRHQRIPGSTWRGLFQRFYDPSASASARKHKLLKQS